VRQEVIVSEGGLVRDVDVTRFQMAIDSLLRTAREPHSTEAMLGSVRHAAVSISSITSAVGGADGYPTPSSSPLSDSDGQRKQGMESVSKLKARVTGTANSLITATKHHAAAFGLSTVALLDAAASNCTAAVVELVKAVGTRPSPHADLNSDVDEHDVGHANATEQEGEELAVDMGPFYDDRLSSGDASFGPAVHAVPQPREVEVGTPEAKPAPLNIGLGRSGTKKGNGWFGGWGKKASTDETEGRDGGGVGGDFEGYQ